jgi:hypothetical protein
LQSFNDCAPCIAEAASAARRACEEVSRAFLRN